jgi:hypothetical protein|nr:MAG TPA: hypothetical protein [Crassvirales sp.]
MPYNSESGIISAPVSIDDVKQALGESSNDLATLCKSDNINMWSLYKPSVNPDIYSDNAYKGGLTITNISLEELSNWFYVGADDRSCAITYEKPYGGEKSPYRLGDFRDYFHKAVCQFYIEVYDGPIDCNYYYDHVDIVLHTIENLPNNNIHINDVFDYGSNYLACAIFDSDDILQNIIIDPFNIANRPNVTFSINRDDIRFAWHRNYGIKAVYIIPCVVIKVTGNLNTKIFPIPIINGNSKYITTLNSYRIDYTPNASVETSSSYVSNVTIREDFKDEYQFMNYDWNFKGYFKVNSLPTNEYEQGSIIFKGYVYSSTTLRISARDIYYTVEGMEIMNYSGIYCIDYGIITNIGTTSNDISGNNYFTIPANSGIYLRFFLLDFYNFGGTNDQDYHPIDGVYRVNIFIRLKSNKQIICAFFGLVFKQVKSYIGEATYIEGSPY